MTNGARLPAAGGATADLIVAMLPDLDPRAVSDLHTMLGHHLATVEPPGERERRLGLLCDLVDAGHLPSTVHYADAREREQAAGHEWPAVTTLIDAYGSYDRALATAVRYCERRAAGRGAGTSALHARRWMPTYTRQEVIAAIRRCRQDLALQDWPPSTVFYRYVDAGRRAARITGGDDPRLPSRRQLRRCFESFAQAVAAADRTGPEPTAAAEVEEGCQPDIAPRRRRRRRASLPLPTKAIARAQGAMP